MQLLLTLSYISLLLIPLLRKTELINQNLFALFLAFNYLIIITKCFNIIKKRDFLNKKSITLLCQINIFFLTLAFIFSLIFSPGNLQNIILDAFGSFLPIPIFLVFAFYDKDIINKPEIKKTIRSVEKLIKGKGRILVRKSGTESKIRIMGESENKILLSECVKIISKKIK